MPVRCGKKQRNKQRKKILEDEFHGFFHTSTEFCATGMLP